MATQLTSLKCCVTMVKMVPRFYPSDKLWAQTLLCMQPFGKETHKPITYQNVPFTLPLKPYMAHVIKPTIEYGCDLLLFNAPQQISQCSYRVELNFSKLPSK